MDGSQRLNPAAVELLKGWPLFDNSIVRHGFVSYMRDYEVVVDAAASAPASSDGRSYIEGRYRFLFTHCVLAHVATVVDDAAWPRSWDEVFTNYAAWEAAGTPDGYVWGVEYMEAYPGASYDAGSALAAEWSRRLGRPMHEVRILTNAHDLQLVFHSLRIHKIAQGQPGSDALAPIAPVDLLAPAT